MKLLREYMQGVLNEQGAHKITGGGGDDSTPHSRRQDRRYQANQDRKSWDAKKHEIRSTKSKGFKGFDATSMCDGFGVTYDAIKNILTRAIPSEFEISSGPFDVEVGKIVRNPSSADTLDKAALKVAYGYIGEKIKEGSLDELDKDTIASTVSWLEENLIGSDEDGTSTAVSIVDGVFEGMKKAISQLDDDVVGLLAQKYVLGKKNDVEMFFRHIEGKVINKFFESQPDILETLIRAALKQMVFSKTLDDIRVMTGHKENSAEWKVAQGLIGYMGGSGFLSGEPLKGGERCANEAGKKLGAILTKGAKSKGICGMIRLYSDIIKVAEEKDIKSLAKTFPGIVRCIAEENPWITKAIAFANIDLSNIENEKDARDLFSDLRVPKKVATKLLSSTAMRGAISAAQAVSNTR